VRVFIFGKQTKENDEGVDSLFFVIAELLSETQGDVLKVPIRHCERSETIRK
jgi:hypothetical protein